MITEAQMQELIDRAHKNARDRGFYDAYEESYRALLASDMQPENMLNALFHSKVAEKLALIASEVWEFRIAGPPYEEVLDELADIAIRIFDLMGFAGLGGACHIDHFDKNRWRPTMLADKREAAFFMYDSVGDAVRNYQNTNEVLFINNLQEIISVAYHTANVRYGDDASDNVLYRAILAKMDKNESREKMHGGKRI